MTAEARTRALDAVELFYRSINARQFDRLNDCLSADWIDHGPLGDHEVRHFVDSMIEVIGALPDFSITVEDRADAADRVFLRLRLTGTHRRRFLGVEATGRPIDIRSHDIHRLDDGRIAESWQLEDWFAAFEQIGGPDSLLPRDG